VALPLQTPLREPSVRDRTFLYPDLEDTSQEKKYGRGEGKGKRKAGGSGEKLEGKGWENLLQWVKDDSMIDIPVLW